LALLPEHLYSCLACTDAGFAHSLLFTLLLRAITDINVQRLAELPFFQDGSTPTCRPILQDLSPCLMRGVWVISILPFLLDFGLERET
jgi:hypothetical protein